MMNLDLIRAMMENRGQDDGQPYGPMPLHMMEPEPDPPAKSKFRRALDRNGKGMPYADDIAGVVGQERDALPDPQEIMQLMMMDPKFAGILKVLATIGQTGARFDPEARQGAMSGDERDALMRMDPRLKYDTGSQPDEPMPDQYGIIPWRR